MTQDHLETFIDQCKAEGSDYIVGIPVGSGCWRICRCTESLGSEVNNLSPEEDMLIMLSAILTNDD